MPYQLHEPFPSLLPARPTYMHTGRGGAGNLHRTTATDLSARNPSTSSSTNTSATRPLSTRTSSSSSSSTSGSASSTFMTGRGGAGNAHPLSERALFSFDEELERAGRMEKNAAPVYHIGRGGAGNLVSSGGSVSSRGSSRKDSSSSDGSDGAGRRSLEWVKRLGRQ